MSGIRRVLILGHTGLIGSAVRRRLEADFKGGEVLGRSSPDLDLTREEHAERLADLFDPATAVVMCSGVKRQLGDSPEIFLQNVGMTAHVCRLLVRRPVGRFVYLSSAAVYGEDVDNTRITEETPPRPRSFYGVAKLASEGLLARTFTGLGEEKLVLLRPPLIYGPGETGVFYGPSGFLRDALADKPVVLWGDGRERREFIYVEDAAQAIVRLALGEGAGVLNLASGRSRTFADAVEVLPGILGRTPVVDARPRTKVKVDNAFVNDKFVRTLPEFRFTSLEDGMRLTADAARAAR